jgi:hypothetical protein
MTAVVAFGVPPPHALRASIIANIADTTVCFLIWIAIILILSP